MQSLVLYVRNGAILATLAATPLLVGFFWNAVWGSTHMETIGTYGALIFAWLAATGLVTALAFRTGRDGNNLSWFYPCGRCKRGVAIFAYRCMHCKQTFAPPSEAGAFRNALLLGVAVFYATFIIAAFLARQSISPAPQ